MQQVFCPSCGTGLAATAKFCGNCGNSIEAEQAVVKTSSTEPVTPRPANNTQPVTEPIAKEVAISTMNLKAEPTSTERLDSAPRVAAAVKRYEGAYRVARLTDMAGHLLKAVAVFMAAGALVVFGFGVKADYLERGFAAIVALLAAGAAFLVFFAAGLVVSAQGQNLKANLDSAVHTSPLLTGEQKAKLLSL
ncbi:MAG TPA: zinc ribbon domain-containing protein [Blastocatellia bacterium]|nr:zinc ribbon domain-containing protein [Blastocatellia bacterium]